MKFLVFLAALVTIQMLSFITSHLLIEPQRYFIMLNQANLVNKLFFCFQLNCPKASTQKRNQIVCCAQPSIPKNKYDVKMSLRKI